VPATLFVATEFLDRPREYWWDELATLLLGGAVIDCDVEDGLEHWRISVGRDDGDGARSWRAWQEPVTERQRAYTETYRRLRSRPAIVRERVVGSLREAAGVTSPSGDYRPMTVGELTAWSDTPGLDVGAHTKTHPVLTALAPADADDEILGSKRACESLLKRAVAGFAYPHGGHDERIRQLVTQSGFSWACTTEERTLQPREPDLYALPRFAAPDCDGPAFERLLEAACRGAS
jgi:peptidoglycan/xylan/chitin deacetylase (PgdA/CDA1 family)